MSLHDAEQFVTLARNLSASGHHARAFQEYVLILNSFPRLKKRLEDEFRVCLMKTNEQLSLVYRRVEIFKNLDVALGVLPRSVPLLDDIGRYLRRYGCFSSALSYCERAHSIDSGSASVERHLNDTRRDFLPARYFRTLNDARKNKRYRRAITSVLIPGKDIAVVLNGAPGLLMMFVGKLAPANRVLVEQRAPLAHLSLEVMNYKLGDVTMMPKPMQAVLHETTLLITDDFDSRLFGRGMLELISNSWEVLKRNKGRVLPARAEYYIIGAQCNSLYHKYNLSTAAKVLLEVPEWNVRSVLLYGEANLSKDVAAYEDMDFITEAELLFKINFNCYEEVKDLASRCKSTYVTLTAKKGGTVNCLVGYFNLYLTEEVAMTTDPRKEDRCSAWQQAVFFNELEYDVIPEQEVPFQFITHHGAPCLKPISPTLTQVTPELLRFLNDADYVNKIIDSIPSATLYLNQIASFSEICILDLCPFPLFGYLMLKRGIKSLTCRVNTYSDRSFIETVFDLNNIRLAKVTFITDDSMYDTFKEEKFHAIYEHPFLTDGDINFRLNRNTVHWENVNLHEDGLVLPGSIQLMGQLVKCPSLDAENWLDDRNLCGYEMEEKINRYSLTIRRDISICNLKFTEFTDAFVLSDHLRGMVSGLVETEVLKDGKGDCLLSYYRITIIDEVSTVTARSGSFMENMAYCCEDAEVMFRGDQIRFLRCVDRDGTFKISFDV